MVSLVTFGTRAALPAGIKAIDAFAAHMAKSDKGLATVYKGLVANFTEADALDLLIAINAKIAEKKSTANNVVTPRDPTERDLSGFKTIFKLKAWDCWEATLDNLATMKASASTIEKVCNFVRSKEAGIPKSKGTAPSVEAIETFMAIKNERPSKAKVSLADKAKASPIATLDDCVASITAMQSVEGNTEHGAFLVSALAALKSYRPAAVKRQQEADAAKGIADAAAKREKAAKAKLASAAKPVGALTGEETAAALAAVEAANSGK